MSEQVKVESRGFNQLKRQVLTLLKSEGSLTSEAIAARLDSKLTNICNVLTIRLYRRKKQREGSGALVDRRKVPSKKRGRPRYVYEINETGLQKLEKGYFTEPRTKKRGEF